MEIPAPLTPLIDPERLMRGVRQAIGMLRAQEIDREAALHALHRHLARRTALDLGVCSVVGKVATSMELRPYFTSRTLLRQGRLCFGWDGICGVDTLQQELCEWVEQRYRQERCVSGGLCVAWDWNPRGMSRNLPGHVDFLLSQCVGRELAQACNDELQERTGQAGNTSAIALRL